MRFFKTLVFGMCLWGASFWAWADPWSIHQGSLTGHGLRIQGLEDKISGLIEEKRRSNDTTRISALIKEMVAAHAELTKVAGERDKELRHMRFDHPEKGQEFDAKYLKTYEVKSLKAFEEELGLSGRLNVIKEKIRLHYGMKKKKGPKVPSYTQPVVEKKKSIVDERIRFTR